MPRRRNHNLANYPTTVAEILDDQATFEPACLAAMRAFKRAKPWEGNFHERASKLQVLNRELARAYGLGGRDRAAGSVAERARMRATKAIRAAIDRIRPHDSKLAEHLGRSVRTGTFCVYSPDPAARVDWFTS